MQPRQPSARSAKIMRHSGASEVTQGVPYNLGGGNSAPASAGSAASLPRAPPLPPVPSAAPSFARGHIDAAQALLSLNASPMVFAPHSRARTSPRDDHTQVAAPTASARNPIQPDASASNTTESRKTTRDRERIVRASSAYDAVSSSSHLSTAASASSSSAAAASHHRTDLVPQDLEHEARPGSNPRLAVASTASISSSASMKSSTISTHSSSEVQRASPERSSKSFICSKCSFQFSKSCHLVDHELAVHSGQEKPFACAFCNHRCMRSSQLTRHTLQCHSEERPYVCDRENCHYRCLTSGDMSRHLRSVHLAERKFSCDLCEYKCSNNSRLQQHKRSMHQGPRLYTCDWDGCEFQCKRAGSMANHKKRVHHAE